MPETRTAVVQLAQGTSFAATSGSGHRLILDTSAEHGGQNLGPTPMELLLVGLAGCIGMTVIDLLRRQRQNVTDYEVRAEGEQADSHPRVYTRIVVTHVVRGRDLDRRVIDRSIELAAARYCPASAMLAAVARIEEVIQVITE